MRHKCRRRSASWARETCSITEASSLGGERLSPSRRPRHAFRRWPSCRLLRDPSGRSPADSSERHPPLPPQPSRARLDRHQPRSHPPRSGRRSGCETLPGSSARNTQRWRVFIAPRARLIRRNLDQHRPPEEHLLSYEADYVALVRELLAFACDSLCVNCALAKIESRRACKKRPVYRNDC